MASSLRDRLRDVLRVNMVTYRSRLPIYKQHARIFEESLLDQLEAAVQLQAEIDVVKDELAAHRKAASSPEMGKSA